MPCYGGPHPPIPKRREKTKIKGKWKNAGCFWLMADKILVGFMCLYIDQQGSQIFTEIQKIKRENFIL